MLRDELFAWFVDIRASLATRISPRFVLLKARQIADVIVQEQVDQCVVADAVEEGQGHCLSQAQPSVQGEPAGVVGEGQGDLMQPSAGQVLGVQVDRLRPRRPLIRGG